MTQKTEEAIKIAEQIQEDILRDKEASTQTLLRQYYSLVILLNKEDEVEWALNELSGYRLISKVPDYRKVGGKNNFAFITHGCEFLNIAYRSGHKYDLSCYEQSKSGSITKKDYRYSYEVNPLHLYNILNTLTTFIYTKTQKILLELKFGKFEFDIFEDTRKVVDIELSKNCPKAFEKLTEAYRLSQNFLF